MALYDSGVTYDSGLRYDEGPVLIPKKKMAKPKLELKRKSDSELGVFAADIVTAMTGNANFATPMPTLASITAKLGEFNAKLSDFNAKTNAAHLANVDKENFRSQLEAMLTHLAGYVEAAAAGEESKILSAGMQVRGTPAPVGELPAPANLTATAGNDEGKIILTWPGVDGASSYELDCRLHKDGEQWQRQKGTTNTKTTVEGLIPGELYAFRVRALGAAGPGAWSDEAVRRAP